MPSAPPTSSAETASPKPGARRPTARLRLVLSREVALGPGKADILEGIRETGSIAAAGRRLHMSYKRAWSLVEQLNAAFAEPLVETRRGGLQKGGAALTPAGARVLDAYRRMERATEAAIGPELEDLARGLKE